MAEIVKWAAALSSLVGFALAMGLNPALYGATADMLARDVEAGPRLRWMVGGLAVGATLLFVIFLSFDPRNLETALKGRVDAAVLNRGVDVVAGIMFLVAATAVTHWRLRVPELPQRPAKTPKSNAGSISYFAIGFSSAVVGFTTLPLMYLTGRVVSALSPDLALRALAYCVFLVALGAPFFTLAWVWSRFPALAKKITAFYTRVLHSDYRWPLAVLLALAGLTFLGLALFAHR
ncbi:MAG: hypothetical protein ACK5LO_02200 [Leucobacter sp.]